jgi:nucleoid DNA-binding protein
MEELIQTVADKTGISPDQARSAIETIVDHLKDKLPLGLGDKIESFLQNGSESASFGDELLGGLKSLF